MAVSTGLRWNELADLKLRQVHLNAAPMPFLELTGRQTKNGKAACIPLRAEVATAIGDYLRTTGREANLDDKLFTQPPPIRVFDADLDAAGISKTDARGRVVSMRAFAPYLRNTSFRRWCSSPSCDGGDAPQAGSN